MRASLRVKRFVSTFEDLPWRFSLEVRPELGGKRWAWRGSLRRGDNRMDLSEPLVLLPGLLVLGVGRAARFDDEL